MPPRPRVSLTRAVSELLRSPIKPDTAIAVPLRPDRPADLALASALSSQHPSVHVLSHPSHASAARQAAPKATVHELQGSQDLRPYAHWAVSNDVRHLALGDTIVDAASDALSTIHAGARNAFVGGSSNGAEMLPAPVLRIHTPLSAVAPQDLADSAAPEHARAAALLGPGVCVHRAAAHAARRRSTIHSLCEQSADLLRAAVVEASHWGYVVARRSTLAEIYHSGAAGRLVAVHALARLVLHVSGSPAQLPLDDEQVARLARDVLALDRETGELVPLPKGRTAAGMVVRPATGRFARRLSQESRRRAGGWRGVQDDLMIFTREPDHESAGLFAKRLGGNWGCVPLDAAGGTAVYWDNRYVLATASVERLREGRPVVEARDVWKAALAPPGGDGKASLSETELYARQIRRGDWERITASASRVRSFLIPFQCIRALPAVFQKTSGEHVAGDLIASPHLGLSARPDLYFVAVRVSRFRCLPEDIDPGFVGEQVEGDGVLVAGQREMEERIHDEEGHVVRQ